MGRLLLFALIGGGLVAAVWLALRGWWGARRERARAAERAAAAAERERLARQQPGGRPDRPIEVESPAVVEPKAAGLPCARCGEPVRVADHQARTLDGERLRVAVVECTRCGLEREVFFRLVGRRG